MFEGSVVSIHISAKASEAMISVSEARAIAGKGLEGDRYFMHERKVPTPEPDRELTLIEVEAVEAFRKDCGRDLSAGDPRRNIVTRGVPLNHLVGREFMVGEVRVRGLRLCEPCAHLARLTYKEVLPGLVHRGGLRAQILNGGLMRPGDPIREVNSAATTGLKAG